MLQALGLHITIDERGVTVHNPLNFIEDEKTFDLKPFDKGALQYVYDVVRAVRSSLREQKLQHVAVIGFAGARC